MLSSSSSLSSESESSSPLSSYAMFNDAFVSFSFSLVCLSFWYWTSSLATDSITWLVTSSRISVIQILTILICISCFSSTLRPGGLGSVLTPGDAMKSGSANLDTLRLSLPRFASSLGSLASSSSSSSSFENTFFLLSNDFGAC